MSDVSNGLGSPLAAHRLDVLQRPDQPIGFNNEPHAMNASQVTCHVNGIWRGIPQHRGFTYRIDYLYLEDGERA